MSKQKGIIKLVGNIGGLSFYASGGEFLARTAGGPTKEQIATGTNFIRTRENNKEFGGSAKVSKSLRTALSGVLQVMGSGDLTSRLTSIFKKINSKAGGIRGQRPIQLTDNKELLQGLELNSKLSFTSVFNAPFAVSINEDRTEATISVPNFIPANFVSAPAGASGFRLVIALGTLSDYSFDEGILSYEPDAPEFNGLGVVSYTAITPLNNTAVALNLTASVPDGLIPSTDVSVVVGLGIEFYQKVNAVDYLLAQGNTMRIVGVY